MKFTLLNLILFKLGWAATVFGAAYGVAWAGAATIAGIAIICLAKAERPQRELTLFIIAAGIGLAWETLLMNGGILVYAGSAGDLLAPYWIVGMWILFASTLNVGMRWMKKNWLLPVLFGGIGGPLSFLAGESIGAVTFPNHSLSIPVIAIGWAILLPALLRVADYFDGHQYDAGSVPAMQGAQS